VFSFIPVLSSVVIFNVIEYICIRLNIFVL